VLGTCGRLLRAIRRFKPTFKNAKKLSLTGGAPPPQQFSIALSPLE
jgi:hypothetical protein